MYRREIVNNVINGSAYKNKPSSSVDDFVLVVRMFAYTRTHSQSQSQGYVCVCLTCLSYIVSGFASVCVCMRDRDAVTLH